MHLDPLAVVAPRAKDAIVRAHAKRAGRNLLRGRSTEAIEAETKRLSGISGKAMSEEKASWVNKRIVLLRNLAKLKKDEL